MSFTDITQEIKEMPFDEKIELQHLLDKYIIEERRQAIYETYKDAQKLNNDDKLEFSSDINELKRMLEE